MIELLQQVTQWWIVLFILGFISLPLTSRLFSLFFDKGYAFSKIVGLLFITYLALALGTLHILPFTPLALISIVIATGLVQFFIAKKTKFWEVVRKNWKIFIYEEVLFFACLFFWSYIKSFQPDIHGLEKFMDYGFINSILRSTYFPPKDMWMTPLSINYYYFGHLMTAVMTKLSFLPSNITFNLMLASIFAFTFTQGFSLGANLISLVRNRGGASETIGVGWRKQGPLLIAGILTAILLTFSGNLHTIYTLFTPYQNEQPVSPSQLVFSPQTFPNQYWYPNATRFIHNTIHEFPMYSFVVSDLHGHVLDIPNVLLILAVLLVIFVSSFKITNSLLLGLLAGVGYMTNAWDGLIYLGVGIGIIIYKTRTKGNSYILRATYSILLLFISFVLISLPFSFFFKPFASQIGLNCAPEFLLRIKNIGPFLFEQGYCQHSPFWQLTILYGFFFFWFVSFLAFLFVQIKRKSTVYLVDMFVLYLGVLGFILIVIPEFVYLKDIYTTYFRANTMFKLVYQAFILLTIVSGYTLVRIVSSIRYYVLGIPRKVLATSYLLLATAFIVLILIYPFFAVSSYFNNLKNFHGLTGTTYLKTINIDDYNAIVWLNTHITGQPVLLEAQGDSYTDYERISSNTGLPTVFGWMVHEWLWRGTYDIVPERVADVKTLYESPNLAVTKTLLRKYAVRYVYIGDMEQTKYPHLNEEKFKSLGQVVYTSGGVTIYKIL